MAKKDDVEVMGAFPLPGDPAPPKKTPFWKKPVFVLGLTVGTIGFAGILFSFTGKRTTSPTPRPSRRLRPCPARRRASRKIRNTGERSPS